MTSKKKMEDLIANGDFGGLFPFLILLFIGLVRFITSKKKKEASKKPTQTTQKGQPPLVQKKSSPSVTMIQPLTAEKTSQRSHLNLEIKQDQHDWRKKKKTRVQRLVKSAGGSQKIILLSEILKKHDFLQF